jgi:hypothetical protein
MMSLLRPINFGVNTKFLLENNRIQPAGQFKPAHPSRLA